MAAIWLIPNITYLAPSAECRQGVLTLVLPLASDPPTEGWLEYMACLSWVIIAMQRDGIRQYPYLLYYHIHMFQGESNSAQQSSSSIESMELPSSV